MKGGFRNMNYNLIMRKLKEIVFYENIWDLEKRAGIKENGK